MCLRQRQLSRRQFPTTTLKSEHNLIQSEVYSRKLAANKLPIEKLLDLKLRNGVYISYHDSNDHVQDQASDPRHRPRGGELCAAG